MRLLLIGGNGQVGFELSTRLRVLGELAVATRSGALPDGSPCLALDLTDTAAIGTLIRSTRPDVVVNAAAYTAVDRAEDEQALAYRINAEAPGVIGDACADIGAHLVHYSTDYVFDGAASSPYGEDSPIAPIGVYGASKAAGEAAVRESGASHLILRTAWVYGLYGQNFLRTMLRLAGERDELRVVADQIGSPTPAAYIAQCTVDALSRPERIRGTHHLTTGGSASWCEFAGAIMDEAFSAGMLARRPEVRAIGTIDYPTRARRPAYSVLDTSAFHAAIGRQILDWQSGLRAVVQGRVYA